MTVVRMRKRSSDFSLASAYSESPESWECSLVRKAFDSRSNLAGSSDCPHDGGGRLDASVERPVVAVFPLR